MHWINLILDYVTTVSYSILIIGEPKPIFKPTRGIYQGDPLSPTYSSSVQRHSLLYYAMLKEWDAYLVLL